MSSILSFPCLDTVRWTTTKNIWPVNNQGSFITGVLSTVSATGNTCVQSSFNFRIYTSVHRRLSFDKMLIIFDALWQKLMSNRGASKKKSQKLYLLLYLHVLHQWATVPTGIYLPPHCTYKQSFNFRLVVLHEIQFDPGN